MKVGILTFHRAKNYGAVLQCYALAEFLRARGLDVDVIDYNPSYFRSDSSFFPFEKFRYCNIKGKVSLLCTYVFAFRRLYSRNKAFNLFLDKFIPLSHSEYNESSKKIEGYDIIFIGSDQVWNREITKGIDRYFSGSCIDERTIKASYAASSILFGEDDEDDYYRNVLSNLDYVSAREKTLTDYLNKFNIKPCFQVLDPVLLLDKNQWENIANKPKVEDYLLLYMVKEDPRAIRIAKQIAEEKGLHLIMIAPKVKLFRKGRCLETLSPCDFLGYFFNASFIVSTSFHGTAFAIKLERQFVTVELGTKTDERSRDLLLTLSLYERYIPVNGEVEVDKLIDYNEVRKALEEKRDYSRNYITSVINHERVLQ